MDPSVSQRITWIMFFLIRLKPQGWGLCPALHRRSPRQPWVSWVMGYPNNWIQLDGLFHVESHDFNDNWEYHLGNLLTCKIYLDNTHSKNTEVHASRVKKQKETTKLRGWIEPPSSNKTSHKMLIALRFQQIAFLVG